MKLLSAGQGVWQVDYLHYWRHSDVWGCLTVGELPNLSETFGYVSIEVGSVFTEHTRVYYT
ncbi:hypothetical protein KSX25_04470 [Acinetobacter baumannii]|nr:hypothetical protein [Acinetobacter baumannii]